MYKITSVENDTRIFLTKNFWSQGTPLGFLGALFLRDVRPGFKQLLFLVILGPCKYLVPVAPLGHSKNPKTAGAWCEKEGE